MMKKGRSLHQALTSFDGKDRPFTDAFIMMPLSEKKEEEIIVFAIDIIDQSISKKFYEQLSQIDSMMPQKHLTKLIIKDCFSNYHIPVVISVPHFFAHLMKQLISPDEKRMKFHLYYPLDTEGIGSWTLMSFKDLKCHHNIKCHYVFQFDKFFEY